ncbi:MAG: hypothetical protein GEU90_21645 [Gemmatimonas sp.]|nr:hypothetical protein [Gemmatimonas sp.]
MMRAAFGVLVVLVAMVSPAWAQSGTGVSVALVGDITRYDGSDTEFDRLGDRSRDGEALGFSLRLDRALGSRWGVELEYVRGGEIESESRVFPVLPAELITSLGELSSSFLSSSSIIFPPPETRSTLKTRLSTVSTLAWFRQSVGDRTSLVYSAGIGFGIGQTESTFAYIGLPNQSTLPAVTSKYTSYSVNPIVGLDARISMTEHASLVPGVRVIGADGGIIVRPSVGLRWEF